MRVQSSPNHHLVALCDVLRQGLLLLDALSDDEYRRALPEAYHASVGGHYRHCLEHFQALLEESESGLARETIDYDARQRDRDLETARSRAVERTKHLLEAFEACEVEHPDASVRVRCKVSYGAGASPEVASSQAREIMYAVVHAIHHYALIGVMCQLMGVRVPDDFGVAPSTAAHRRDAGMSPNAASR